MPPPTVACEAKTRISAMRSWPISRSIASAASRSIASPCARRSASSASVTSPLRICDSASAIHTARQSLRRSRSEKSSRNAGRAYRHENGDAYVVSFMGPEASAFAAPGYLSTRPRRSEPSITLARGSSSAAGDDCLEAAHRSLEAEACAPRADPAGERVAARARASGGGAATSPPSGRASSQIEAELGRQRAHERDRRAARVVGETIERDLERVGRPAVDERARVLPGLRILDREALALEIGERDLRVPRARAFRDRWRSRRDPTRSRRAPRSRAARPSRRAGRAFRGRSARARRRVTRRIDAQRLAPGEHAERLGLRLLVRRKEIFEHERVPGRAPLRPPPTRRAAAARAAARSRARRRRAARPETASRRPRRRRRGPASSVAGPSMTSRLSARRSPGISRSSSTSSARCARIVSVPSMTTSPSALGALSTKS